MFDPPEDFPMDAYAVEPGGFCEGCATDDGDKSRPPVVTLCVGAVWHRRSITLCDECLIRFSSLIRFAREKYGALEVQGG